MEGSESKTFPKAPLSPPGSPPKAHESIWKRSKKILGMSRFAFLQQIDAQGPRDKTSPGGGGDGANGKPPVSKRREQVRRAQKTHRQRTENYIKALEQEVLRLQKEEADRAWERQNKQHSDAYVKALEKQVVGLQKEKALLQRDTDSQFPPAATLTLYDQNGEWALKAEMPQYPAFVSPSEISSPIYGSSSVGGDSSYGQPYSSNWHNLMLINPLANHQTAIDFVLSIEAECMKHLHQHIAKPGTINGHSLTASACLIEQSPMALTAATTTTSVPLGSTWTTSHAEIERLFQLASNLGLEGEITPVEAWNRIWQHPLAPSLSIGGLKSLEGGLKKIVCCYGFGGAINEKDFAIVLDNAIAQG